LIQKGKEVERDTYFWTELVKIVGDLVPQLLTQFVK